MTELRIIRGGLLTTIQDQGRWGYQGSGIPVAGPMDPYSFRVANRLAGNPDAAAALEITLIGPELEATGDAVCAVAGAEFELIVDDRIVPCGRAFHLRRGAALRFGRRRAGARAFLAVHGGIDVPAVLGSRASSLISRLGPFGGRPLGAGDVLPVGRLPEPVRATTAPFLLPLPRGGARLRVIPGPQEAMFPADALEAFFSARYEVTSRSNRMGYRLSGTRLSHADGADILSEATPIGAVQVPGEGQPILLMADRQTTGGYPKIATVIGADIPLAGQLAPGDWVQFVRCTRGDALEALRRQERMLAGRRP